MRVLTYAVCLSFLSLSVALLAEAGPKPSPLGAAGNEPVAGFWGWGDDEPKSSPVAQCNQDHDRCVRQCPGYGRKSGRVSQEYRDCIGSCNRAFTVCRALAGSPIGQPTPGAPMPSWVRCLLGTLEPEWLDIVDEYGMPFLEWFLQRFWTLPGLGPQFGGGLHPLSERAINLHACCVGNPGNSNMVCQDFADWLLGKKISPQAQRCLELWRRGLPCS